MVIISLLLFIFTFKKLYVSLSIMQQQFYNIERYFIYKKENYNIIDFMMFCFGIIAYILNREILSLLLLLLLLIYCFPIIKKRIIKLKITKRIVRIFCVHFIFLLSLSFLTSAFDNQGKLLIVIIVLNLYDYLFLVPFSIEIIIEKMINKYYYNLAKKKIKHSKIKVIGITGSYAKTSIKNYLYSVLINKYKVLMTPKSYNTILGVCKTINEANLNNYDYIIIEIGLDKTKSINKFLKLFDVEIGIVSGISKQHFKTFKSLENIAKEKIKLALNSKVSFVNTTNKEIIPYINESMNTYNENELEIINNNSFKYDQEIYTTLVHGQHFFVNLLCVIKVAKYLNVSSNLIKESISKMKNVEHRFELKMKDGVKVIDDAYNSNVYSFNKALDSFSRYENYKIIITPGLIELGSENYKINKNIAKRCVDICDLVFVVGNNIAFKDLNNKKIQFYMNFKDAYNAALNVLEDKIILIENDLGDFYIS